MRAVTQSTNCWLPLSLLIASSHIVAAEATYHDASEFASANLSEQVFFLDREGGGEQLYVFRNQSNDFAPSSWTWDRRIIIRMAETDERVTVDPKYLEPKVVIGKAEIGNQLVPYVEIRCSTGACITVTRVSVWNHSGKTTETTTRVVSYSEFYAPSEDMARRIGNAFENMIKLSGGKAPAF